MLILSADSIHPSHAESSSEIPYPASLRSGISGRLRQRILASTEEEITVWIFFRDHGAARSQIAERAGDVFGSERSLTRTRNRGKKGISIDGPPPVETAYIEELGRIALQLRHCSRYLNAVSAVVRAKDIDEIASLPFVGRVDEVSVFKRRPDTVQPHNEGAPERSPMIDPWSGFYGESLNQLEMIESLDLLEEGYNCSGEREGADPVVICILDTGFDRTHEAFQRLNVMAEYDFINFDAHTGTEPGDDPFQAVHGTTVLGVLGGYMPGELIGPAWGAAFLLGKTEIYDQEIRSEEDKWVAAVEWADSIGVDIISSSVGYIGSFGNYWYDPDSLNGDFAVCTRAADIAVSRGIVVVNAVGNKNWYQDSLLVTPADGDSVLAVGAVDRNGVVASFSKHGPTADGRIKPDLVAQGVEVRSILAGSHTDYQNYSGTSYSTPLVAGVCGQLLEIHSEWNPIALRDSLRANASRSSSPDNVYGYGIPRGFEASGLTRTEYPVDAVIGPAYPNPFRSDVRFDVYFGEWDVLTISVYDCSGRLVRKILDEFPLTLGGTITWDGRDDYRRRVVPGVYFVRFVSMKHAENVKVVRLD